MGSACSFGSSKVHYHVAENATPAKPAEQSTVAATTTARKPSVMPCEASDERIQYREPRGVVNHVSQELVDNLKNGRVVAFLGAGWDSACNFPSWVNLLKLIIKDSQGNPLTDAQCHHLEELISAERPSSSALDQCAQELQDRLGNDTLVRRMERYLTPPETLPPLMEKRMELLRQLPFRGIITTNYSSLLPGKTPWDEDCPYRQLLRPRDCADDPPHSNGLPPTIQAHGNFPRPSSVVFTRMAYRSLLYHIPEYVTFLRCLMASTTILYLGFSFTDAYLNEIRSEIVSMLDDGPDPPARPPIAYGLVPNMAAKSRDFFLRHEGVSIISWDPQTQGWGFFEEFLEELLARVKAA